MSTPETLPKAGALQDCAIPRILVKAQEDADITLCSNHGQDLNCPISRIHEQLVALRHDMRESIPHTRFI